MDYTHGTILVETPRHHKHHGQLYNCIFLLSQLEQTISLFSFPGLVGSHLLSKYVVEEDDFRRRRFHSNALCPVGGGWPNNKSVCG